jgi:hypothetical protein
VGSAIDKIQILFPAIRIHTWGGLGSQLFTANLVLKLQEKYPYRRLNILIHTSGVTRRECEFDFGSLNVVYKQIEDYESKHNKDTTTTSVDWRQHFFNWIVQKIRRLLDSTSLIKSTNDDLSFESLRPWIFSLRGHYTNLNLDKSRVLTLFNTMYGQSWNENLIPSKLVIHYRLGDLLEIKEKDPIKPNRIETLIIKNEIASESALIMSDSSAADLIQVLENSAYLKSVKIMNATPQLTITQCISADTFVGTNAKLSLWAAIFRVFLFDKPSYLPIEMNWKKEIQSKCNWY